MTRRVEITAWGTKINNLNLPGYAVRRIEDEWVEPKIDAICRAISSKTGLDVMSRYDSYQPTSHHYELTLTRPCADGGHNVEGKIWVSV